MGEPEDNPDQRTQAIGNELPPRLAEDQFYSSLASSQRRRLLYYLLETTESTVAELATVLSGWEVTNTGTMHTQADRTDMAIELVHNHLPRLANAGLIEYDTDKGSVQIESLHPHVTDIIYRSIEAEALEES